LREAFAQVLRRGDEVRDPERWIWPAAFRIAAGELKERRRTEMTVAAGRTRWRSRRATSSRRSAPCPNGNEPRSSSTTPLATPAREIARIVESTEAAIRVHVMHGRRRLRDLLRELDDA
jgi:hypothetical protein